MVGSRTITVLVVLLAAMTIGALVLMYLQTGPILPAKSVAAIASDKPGPAEAVFNTQVPLQPLQWRNIIIHGSASEGRAAVEESHFLIDGDGKVLPTDRWASQTPARRMILGGRNWNLDSVGICLEGDFSQAAPSHAQYRSLQQLVGTLQSCFNIPADRVYLYRHLDGASRSPGEAFPADDFNARLLRPQQ
jgi:hypothetical protein